LFSTKCVIIDGQFEPKLNRDKRARVKHTLYRKKTRPGAQSIAVTFRHRWENIPTRAGVFDPFIDECEP